MKKSKVPFSLLRAADGTSYLFPFSLVTSLFLLWGFAHGLLDVLDKHFQNTLHVSKAQSGMVQFSLYIGYLVMAGPAGTFMKRYGYHKGIILGLSLFALGAFLFYPACSGFFGMNITPNLPRCSINPATVACTPSVVSVT